MKTVFVDTSGFFALLNPLDPFHGGATHAFERAEKEKWSLVTTSYVLHETWALVQHKLGWEALDSFLDVLLPLCQVETVKENLHALGAARCRQAHLRRLSLTDCVSFEFMKQQGITEAIARDEHFAGEKITLPE